MTNDPHRSEGRRCQAAEQQPLIILPFHSAAASIQSAAPPQPENRFASSLLSPSCIHSSSRLVPPPSATTKVLNAHPSFSFTGTPSCSTKASLRAAVVGCAAHPPQNGAAAPQLGETFRSGRAFNQIVADARGRADSGRCMGGPTGADMKEDERWDTHVGLKGELPCSRRQQLNHSRRKTTRFEQRMEAVVARERRKERREDELVAAAGKPAGSLGGLQVPYDHELAHLMCDPLDGMMVLDTPHSIANERVAAERPPWVEQMHLGCHTSDDLRVPATATRLSIGNHDRGQEGSMREAVRVSHRRAKQRQQLREDERRLRLWSGAGGSKSSAQGHHRVTSSSPSSPLERAFDAKEASIAAAIDALMRAAFRGGWRPQRSQANAADDCCHHPSANNHGVVAPLMANVLSILPTDVVMVFDTSALISASNWVDVLELITSFGNTVVLPPTVLHELDFTIKRWRSREHAEWVARQQGDKSSGDEDAAGTGSSTKTRFRRTKRQRGDDDDEVRGSTDRRRDADEALAKRALVLRDWFSVVTQRQRLVNEVSDDAECDDAEAVDRLALRFAPGLVTVAQHADSVEFLSGDGRHPMPPAHNNDDRILRVAMYLAHQFVVMPAVNEDVPSSAAVFVSPPRRRRPVILITDDRVMAMKARVEQITVATSLQLLNWK